MERGTGPETQKRISKLLDSSDGSKTPIIRAKKCLDASKRAGFKD